MRVSAGYWTALDLAENLGAFWSPGTGWTPEFVHCDENMDIARREIDIGIRNSRPAQPWLAGRKVGRVTFAVYGRDESVDGWIGLASDARLTPSARWIAETHRDAVVARVNAPHIALALAQRGVGRTVLPTFAGDARPGLVRLSPPIEALETDQWLVAHHDGRHTSAVRTALDALGPYLAGRAP